MSEILRDWLNVELCISRPVESFELDLSNGYLIGEVLTKLNYITPYDFEDNFKDNSHENTLVTNWRQITQALGQLNVQVKPSYANDIIERKPGAALSMVYKLKMAENNMIDREQLNTTVGFQKSKRFTQKLPNSRAVHSQKPAYDSLNKGLNNRTLLAKTYLDNKEKRMTNLLQKYSDHQLEREKTIRMLEAQDSEARSNWEENNRFNRLDTMRESAKFKADWQEDGYRQWAQNMEIASARKQVDRKFTGKKKQKVSKRRVTASEASKKELAEGIEAFERNLQQLRGDEKAQLGNTLSYSLSRGTPQVGTRRPPSTLRPMSADRGRGRRFNQQAEDGRPATGGPNEHIEELRRMLPTEKEQQELARQQRQIITDQTEDNRVLRQDRSRRRRAQVASSLLERENSEGKIASEYLDNLVTRTCDEDRRLTEELWRSSQFEHIFRENKLFLDQQLSEKATLQNITEIDRDRSIHASSLALYEDEISMQKLRHDEIRVFKHQEQHAENYAFCKSLVHRVLDVVEKTVCFKDLSDTDWAPQNTWNEWMSVFVKGLPLLGKPKPGQDEEEKEAAVVDGATELAADKPATEEMAVEVPSVDVNEIGGIVRTEMANVVDLSDEQSMLCDKLSLENFLEQEGLWMTAVSSAKEAEKAAAAADGVTSPTDLPKFNALLGEVVHRVISLACGTPKDIPQKERTAIGICLVGKAFSGKRTQAKFLADAFQLKLLSPDQLVSDIAASSDDVPLHETVRELLMEGQLISDEIYVQLIANAIGDMATPLVEPEEEEPEDITGKAAVIADVVEDGAEEAAASPDAGAGAEPSPAVNGAIDSVPEDAEAEAAAAVAVAAEEAAAAEQAAAATAERAEAEAAAAAAAPTISKNAQFKGWVLINFPETPAQAALLEQALSGFIIPQPNAPGPPKIVNRVKSRVPSRIAPPPPSPPRVGPYPSGIDLVVSFNADDEVVTRRALGRRVDPTTGNTWFHIEHETPDDDAATKEKLVRMEEELHTEAKLPEAFNVYNKEVDGVTAWFTEFATILPVNGDRPRDEVSQTLRKLVDDVLLKRVQAKEAVESAREAAQAEIKCKENAQAAQAAEISQFIPAEEEKEEDESEGDEPSEEEAGESKEESSVAPVEVGPVQLSSFFDEELSQLLAKKWIGLESSYTDGMQDIARKLRKARCTNLDHFSFLRKSFLRFLQRADTKMMALEPFQDNFNEMHPDLRKDVGAKDELHQRTDELCEQLIDIVDERKTIANEQFTKINEDGWLENALSIFSFLYSSMMQLEVDRYHGTTAIVKDYFAVLNSQVVAERDAAVIVDLPINVGDAGGGGGGAKKGAKIVKSGKASKGKNAKGKGPSAAAIQDPEVSSIEVPLEPLTTIVQTALDSIWMPLADEPAGSKDAKDAKAKKKDKQPAKDKQSAKGKSAKGKKSEAEVKPDARDEASPSPELDFLLSQLTEFATKEADIFRRRLNILLEAAKKEMTSLAGFVQAQLYTKMRTWMIDRINGEYEAINTLVFFVKTRIEEELPLHFRLRLEDESFYVDDITAKPLPKLPETGPFESQKDPKFASALTEEQLDFMAKLCHCHASDGLLSTSTMSNMLVRLACTQLRCLPSESLPVNWWDLGAGPWSKVVGLFDPLNSNVVDWREWVLALALQSRATLSLDALQSLREKLVEAADDNDGSVTWEQFASVPVFSDNADAEIPLKRLLFRLFSSKTPWPVVDPTQVPVPSRPTTATTATTASTASASASVESEGSHHPDEHPHPDHHLRRDLHNESLGKDDKMNITILLLNLCFDDDKMLGLDKANTLCPSAEVEVGSEVESFLRRISSTHRSKFVPKDVAHFISGLSE